MEKLAIETEQRAKEAPEAKWLNKDTIDGKGGNVAKEKRAYVSVNWPQAVLRAKSQNIQLSS